MIKNLQKIRRELDHITVGHAELKDALVAGYTKRVLGVRGGHVLSYGPTGVGKTHTVKGFVELVGRHADTAVPYERVSGNPDLMPSDFLFRRQAEYDSAGRPSFVWSLQKVGSFERREGALPGILQFDELDKVPPAAQFGLLEAMEEQAVTVLDGRTVPLHFMLVATANTRRFDPTAKQLARSVQDRFGSVVFMGFLSPEEDLEMLERHVAAQALPVRADDDLTRGIVTAVKLTQQRVDGFTDFTRYVKVPAGPRAILDLYFESAVEALLEDREELTAGYVLRVGLRVLRGRVEATPEAEIEGMGIDVLITKILAEVFAGAARSHSHPPLPRRVNR